MKYLFALSFLWGICLHSVYGQDVYHASAISGTTQQIVSAIQEENQLLGEHISIDATRPEQYDRFEKLKRVASVAELRALTLHPSGVVRCYAFWALADNGFRDLLPMVYAHMNDTAKVVALFGCVMTSPKVGDVFIEIVRPGFLSDERQVLDSVQYAQLDSVLLYTPSKLASREIRLYYAPPVPALYPAIRSCVAVEHNPMAVAPLSRYKRAADVPLILASEAGNETGEGFNFVYEAISNFPHPDFFPLLKKNLEQTLTRHNSLPEWEQFYKAIAAYQNKAAYALLERSLTSAARGPGWDDRLNYLTRAVSKYRCPVYDSLLWTLWIDEKCLSADAFGYLLANNPRKAVMAAKATLLEPEAYNLTGNYDEAVSVSKQDLVTGMVDLVLENDREAALALIGRQIRETGFDFFEVFSRKAAVLKDITLVEPLLQRMTLDDEPSYYREAARILASYNNKAINARILAVIKQKPGRYWGDDAFLASLKE
ncbi:hypothetical protein [Taibaiella chishuiensis]|uniref:Uncharacterized protein n=1 Tax=Taibaiella chishuiensis TaxID=1434707 RepID=A0A2P8D1K3_9BACT|nr:hypothetical protein [Taibaiella chishuiensis]PSK91110.1 hypothetical protein B0I18_106121 [Taibaiella chishuiensis]